MVPLNVPNVLTVIRILLVPVFVVALLDKTSSGDLLAAIVFAVASLTGPRSDASVSVGREIPRNPRGSARAPVCALGVAAGGHPERNNVRRRSRFSALSNDIVVVRQHRPKAAESAVIIERYCDRR